MPIRRSQRFKRAYLKLPSHIRAKVDRVLRLLEADFRHPSLQSKPIRGTDGIYEARVDQHYRLTYERREGDILYLRTVGRHDEALRNP